ncbi:hypothetical protein ACFUYE_05995 [Micromonospora humida]|uniref:hypothetical protein n=1 Tax=Micromonospora humida TaxID=2809018 RepID=UPI00366D2945
MSEEQPHVEFEITVVDGEQGRRLATLQANAILDALQWLADHHHATGAENNDAEEPSR